VIRKRLGMGVERFMNEKCRRHERHNKVREQGAIGGLSGSGRIAVVKEKLKNGTY